MQIVTTPANAQVIVDGRPAPTTPFWLKHGPHRVVVRRPGYETLTTTPAIRNGPSLAIINLAIAKTPPKRPEPLVNSTPKLTPRPALFTKTTRRGTPLVRIAAWTTLSVGVALLAGGLTAQLLARSRSQDANHTFDQTPVAEQDLAFQQKYSRLRGQAETRQKIAIGLFAGGGALIATAVILFAIKPKRHQERLSWTLLPTRNGLTGAVRF